MPFESDTLGDLCDRIDKAAYTSPASLNSGVPREVTQIIARCLRKNPAERYQTAQELSNDVRKLTALVSTPDLRPDAAGEAETLRYPVQKPAGANRTLLVAGGAAALIAVLVVVVAGAYMLMSGSSTETARGDNVAVGPLNRNAPANVGASKAGAVGAEKSIEVYLTHGGSAEVYRDGQLLGATPYKMNVRIGERVRVTLKREGYKDEAVDFTVTESKRDYAFTMTKQSAVAN
jgi:hypothetical protein